MDFFESVKGSEVHTLMAAIKKALRPPATTGGADKAKGSDLKGRIWVTRRDPHIDRLATAWLIRRFVDPAARFRFVDPAGGPVRSGERSFDMVGARVHPRRRQMFIRDDVRPAGTERCRAAATRGNRPRPRPQGREVRACRCFWGPATDRRFISVASGLRRSSRSRDADLRRTVRLVRRPAAARVDHRRPARVVPSGRARR